MEASARLSRFLGCHDYAENGDTLRKVGRDFIEVTDDEISARPTRRYGSGVRLHPQRFQNAAPQVPKGLPSTLHLFEDLPHWNHGNDYIQGGCRALFVGGIAWPRHGRLAIVTAGTPARSLRGSLKTSRAS